MRVIVAAMLTGPLLATCGTAMAQPAPPPLFGETCTVTLPHSTGRYRFMMVNGAPTVHIWSNTPNASNEFKSLGDSPVTIKPDGSMDFIEGHFRVTVVPDGKGKGHITLAGTLNRSSDADFDACVPSK